MIKKHMIALFVDTTPEAVNESWVRIKKSTELTLAMNPETEDVDYISDEAPTTELKEYKPQIEQPLKMIQDEPDFEFFWDKFYNLDVGGDAKTHYLIVFMFDKEGTGESATYGAWSGDCMLSFSELAANDSELKFNLAFGGNVKKGRVTVSGTAPDFVPVFIEDTEA